LDQEKVHLGSVPGSGFEIMGLAVIYGFNGNRHMTVFGCQGFKFAPKQGMGVGACHDKYQDKGDAGECFVS
jgi:hypothetical protein